MHWSEAYLDSKLTKFTCQIQFWIFRPVSNDGSETVACIAGGINSFMDDDTELDYEIVLHRTCLESVKRNLKWP